MKLTKSQLKQIIREELQNVLQEEDDETSGSGSENVLTPGKKMKQKCKKLETWNAKKKKCEPIIKDKKVKMVPAK